MVGLMPEIWILDFAPEPIIKLWGIAIYKDDKLDHILGAWPHFSIDRIITQFDMSKPEGDLSNYRIAKVPLGIVVADGTGSVFADPDNLFPEFDPNDN